MTDIGLRGGHISSENRAYHGPMIYRDDGTWLDAVREAVKSYRAWRKETPARLICNEADLEAVTAAASKFKAEIVAGPIGRNFLWAVGGNDD